MEYQKIANLLDIEASNQPSRFRAKIRLKWMMNQEEHILVVNVILTWSKDSVNANSRGARKFEMTETRFFVPLVTLSTQDNTKLL